MVRDRQSKRTQKKMRKANRIGVLEGGSSAEADVSRSSASQITRALQAQGYETKLIDIGQTQLTDHIMEFKPDVIFPALHGPVGEDGTIQGFLEILGIPYVGSDVRGSALAMDKSISKQIFDSLEIPIASGILIENLPPSMNSLRQIIKESLGEKVVIKPINQGSALGVEIVSDLRDLKTRLTRSLDYGPCLIESFIEGREITVGILDIGGKTMPFPVIEIVTAENEWYNFTNRYGKNLSEHIIPAPLPDSVSERLQDLAISAHKGLRLRDLSRADFIVSHEGEIVMLEVNTLPGMTETSLYPDGARHLGYMFPELIKLLVDEAFRRSS